MYCDNANNGKSKCAQREDGESGVKMLISLHKNKMGEEAEIWL